LLSASLKVAKKGYYGGDPQKVREARLDDVLSILEYEGFLQDYEIVDYNINNPKR
jgi:hypothetical protein